jgi:hypothetical protein
MQSFREQTSAAGRWDREPGRVGAALQAQPDRLVAPRTISRSNAVREADVQRKVSISFISRAVIEPGKDLPGKAGPLAKAAHIDPSLGGEWLCLILVDCSWLH